MRFASLSVGAVVAVLLIDVSRAGSFDEEHQAAIAHNPEGVSVQLQFRGGRNAYREGEPIPLLMTMVRGDGALQDYHLNTDHGGLGFDDKIVTDRPPDVVDPLEGLFRLYPDRKMRFPGPVENDYGRDARPMLYVNGVCRFAKPGKYRLYVVTDRLTDTPTRHFTQQNRVRATSEIIELEILPRDPVRDADEFERFVKIDRSQGWDVASNHLSIHFLQTPAAIDYLVQGLCRADRDLPFGLYLAADTGAIERKVENELYAPDHPIKFGFITTLTDLSLIQVQVVTKSGAKDPRYARTWAAFMIKLLDAVWVKDDRARASSIMTLLWWKWRWQDLGKPEPERRYLEQLPLLVDEVLRLFDSLSDQEQGLVMVAGLIPDEKRLPFLRRIYADARRLADEGILPKGQRYAGRVATAINELLRAVPSEGEKIIADEERNPRPVLNARQLSNLKRRMLTKASPSPHGS
jgi:hypothetical protein